MTYWQAWMACGLLMSLPAAAQADIFRWDNGQLIPGTQGITPGPGVNLGAFSDSGEWSSPERNLRFADFSGGLDLSEASFWRSWLDNSRFNGANLTRAYLSEASLTNADLSGTNLTNAHLFSANLTNADLSGTNLSDAVLWSATLTNADLSGTNLSGASLWGSTLTNANFAGAVVAGVGFSTFFGDFGEFLGSDITLPQLYSTASYQQRNLRGIRLIVHDLTSGEFSGQDLTGADLGGSTLTNANLAGANLTNAVLSATLTNVNFAGAVVAGAIFVGTTSVGFTKEQLYSTASYQQRDLNGIHLVRNDLTGWGFSGQDLTGASIWGSTLTNANFSFADLRGAYLAGPFQLTRNTIREFGAINGLDLAAGETLVVRDSDIGISVRNSMNIVSGGTLEFVLADADWGSTMAVTAGVTPDLGGTLRIRFADQANLASMLGTTFDFFDWPAVLDTNNRFDAIELPPGTQWDLDQLYVTGTAQLTFIPVPPGDYNRDGTVDAADYVVWRKGLGTTYTQADYDVWRANFGQTIGSGGALPSAEPLPIAIPEPATLALLIMAIVVHYARRRSTGS